MLQSETYRGFVILRSNFKSRSDADIKSAVDHGKRVKVYPLGGDPASTVFVDAYDKPFDATIPYDATFFEHLDRFVQAELWLTRDKAMIDSLKTIGIEKGKPFKPDAKTKAILEDAVKEAHAVIGLKYENGFVPAFFEGTRWSVPVPPGNAGRSGQQVRRPKSVRHRWPVGDVSHGLFQPESFWERVSFISSTSATAPENRWKAAKHTD
ncbi:MAG: hypothetical protein QM760_21490 [Nibricoccus sp.]